MKAKYFQSMDDESITIGMTNYVYTCDKYINWNSKIKTSKLEMNTKYAMHQSKCLF